MNKFAKKVRFSILTVVYNRVETLERAIKSVLSQKDIKYEYVIIDGGSNDGSIDIIKEYSSYITYWESASDKGIYDAMNKGINFLSGEYVILLNSDDWLEPNVLSLLDEYINTNDLKDEIICGNMNYFLNLDEPPICLTANLKRFKRLISSLQNPIRHPATIVPLNVYQSIGKFDDSYLIAADEEFILRAYFKKIQFVFVDLVITNMQAGGISSNKSSHEIIYREHIKTLKRYSKTQTMYLYLKCRFFIKINIKKLLPATIMKYIRR